MGYVGNEPDANYTSFAQQTITGNGGTSYTLSHAVASGKEILLYINNVKQEEGSGKAYEATGTALTLSEAITSSDSCYCVFLGKALQTTVPPDGSVTSAKLATAFPSASLDMNGTELILDADGDTSITADTENRVDVKIGGSDIAHVTSSGLGIGTTSNDGALHVKGISDHGRIVMESGGTSGSDNGMFMQFHNNGGTEIAQIAVDEGATNEGQMLFKTGGTTARMTIAHNGQITLNPVSVPSSPTLSINQSNNTKAIAFFTAGTERGNITVFDSSVAFNTSSDYRLKENVVTDWDATTRLKQLKPSRFNFKADKDTTVDGFLAHEVSSIVPEAITGEKDAVDKEGNPVHQGIDQSKLVPLLVKTIQELEARITALEGK